MNYSFVLTFIFFIAFLVFKIGNYSGNYEQGEIENYH